MSDSDLGIVDKSPDDTLDWDVIFSRWLPSGDYLTAATVTIGAGTTATLHNKQVSADAVKVWLTGGAHGEDADVTVVATTAQARVKALSFRLRVRNP